MFVELNDLYIEGLIHITELGEDYFHFDPVRHCLKGERTGQVYRLGDRVEVQVAQVVLDTRKIDLRLVRHLADTVENEAASIGQDSAEVNTTDDVEKPKKKRRSRNYANKKRSRSRSKKAAE
jgi:ribonuclease R